jgi:hypothetical protein
MCISAVYIDITHSCGSRGLSRRARSSRSRIVAVSPNARSGKQLTVSAIGEFGLIASDRAKSSLARKISRPRYPIANADMYKTSAFCGSHSIARFARRSASAASAW